MMLEVNGLSKMAEEDTFEDGCNPATTQVSDVQQQFKAENQETLISDICEFLGIEDNADNYELNACEELGRIDFVLIENGQGHRASDRELESWKHGKVKLWYCVYSAYVEDVIRQAYDLQGVNNG